MGEVDGEFVLPLAGFESFGFAYRIDHISLDLSSEDLEYVAHIQVAPAELHPRVIELAAARARVRSATATQDWTLRVTFEDDSVLEVPSSDDVKWQVMVQTIFGRGMPMPDLHVRPGSIEMINSLEGDPE